jgi:hypothetical protein
VEFMGEAKLVQDLELAPGVAHCLESRHVGTVDYPTQ